MNIRNSLYTEPNDGCPGLGLDEYMVAWDNRIKPPVAVGLCPDETGWSDKYSSTCGSCYSSRKEMNLDQKALMMFIDFQTIVVTSGIDPIKVHEAFLNIAEYRRRISPDIMGAYCGEC